MGRAGRVADAMREPLLRDYCLGIVLCQGWLRPSGLIWKENDRIGLAGAGTDTP